MNKLEIIKDVLTEQSRVYKPSASVILDYIDQCCYDCPNSINTEKELNEFLNSPEKMEEHFIGNIHLALKTLTNLHIERCHDEITNLKKDIERLAESLAEAHDIR